MSFLPLRYHLVRQVEVEESLEIPTITVVVEQVESRSQDILFPLPLQMVEVPTEDMEGMEGQDLVQAVEVVDTGLQCMVYRVVKEPMDLPIYM